MQNQRPPKLFGHEHESRPGQVVGVPVVPVVEVEVAAGLQAELGSQPFQRPGQAVRGEPAGPLDDVALEHARAAGASPARSPAARPPRARPRRSARCRPRRASAGSAPPTLTMRSPRARMPVWSTGRPAISSANRVSRPVGGGVMKSGIQVVRATQSVSAANVGLPAVISASAPRWRSAQPGQPGPARLAGQHAQRRDRLVERRDRERRVGQLGLVDPLVSSLDETLARRGHRSAGWDS